MKIIETYNWNRRDFSAKMQCEGCDHIQKEKGCYDDDNFYNNVIPNSFKCENCGKTSKDLGTQQEKVIPKYPSHLVM